MGENEVQTGKCFGGANCLWNCRFVECYAEGGVIKRRCGKSSACEEKGRFTSRHDLPGSGDFFRAIDDAQGIGD